eukprot:scaffold353_cov201-Alexandrium_tamarense.AAC.20
MSPVPVTEATRRRSSGISSLFLMTSFLGQSIPDHAVSYNGLHKEPPSSAPSLAKKLGNIYIW